MIYIYYMNQKIKQNDLIDNKWYAYHEYHEGAYPRNTVRNVRNGPYNSKKEATGWTRVQRPKYYPKGVYTANGGHSVYMTGKTAKKEGYNEWELDEVNPQ